MAETQSGETIRSMISGFNAMQAQLGLLPVQGGNQPLGVSLPPPPDPPVVASPGEISIQANQLMQTQAQQTVQAAQMTRYAPPPSSPPMGGGGMPVSGGGGGGGGMGMNPFVAQALGGGGGGGMGMPHPMMMTAPNLGGYRSTGAAATSYLNPGHAPSPFNPFAVQPPAPHFGMQYQQDYRMMQGDQSARAGFAGGAVRGGMGLAGGVAGGALGSAFGPLGTAAGAYIGAKAGGALGNFVFGSAMSDIEKGRNVQNMTAPYMVGGASLNPFTGQGMNREAGIDTARGIRKMTYDHVFERQTGFNTADIRNITQLSSDQGMLETAQGSEDILRKVKMISKSVKALMRISGDPDVKAAINSLATMKNLGFEGLSGQLGAAANTPAFARMAGVSQAAMQRQYGAPGAMMAQNMGLVGATGWQAGMMGGAQANMAVGAGAFTDLQKARGGGRQGIAQSNMMAMLGAVNRDEYLTAALTRNEAGELSVDMKAYKQAQSMAFGDVARMAQDKVNMIGRRGIEEYHTRRNEFKDQIAQQMGPMGMQENFAKQVRALQKETQQTTGAAISTLIRDSPAGRGMSDEQVESTARSLELQMTNRKTYDAQIQQLMVERRKAADRERSRISRNRTPGLITRFGEGTRDVQRGISGAVTGWANRNILEPLARVGEDRAAQERGEQIMRFSDVELIHSDAERRLTQDTLQSADFQEAYAQQGPDPFGLDRQGISMADLAGGPMSTARGLLREGIGKGSTVGRMGNRMLSTMGFAARSDANQMVAIASRGKGTFGGWHPLETFGDVGDARKKVEGYQDIARASADASQMTKEKARASSNKMTEQAAAMNIRGFDPTEVLSASSGNLIRKIGQLTAGRPNFSNVIDFAISKGTSATALSGEESKEAFIEAATTIGNMTRDQAESYYASNKEMIDASNVADVRATGNRKYNEVIDRTVELGMLAGGVGGAKSREEVEKISRKKLAEGGLGKMGMETMGKLARHIVELDPEVFAMATQIIGSQLKAVDKDTQNEMYKEIRENAKGRFKTEKELNAYMAELKVKGREAADRMTEDSDVTRAVKEIAVAGTTGEKNIMETVESVTKGIGGFKAKAAQESFQKKLGAKTGQTSVTQADSPWEAMKKVNLSKLDPGSDIYEMAKKIQQGGKADQKVLESELGALVAKEGPTAERALFGGTGGAEVAGIDEQIDRVKKMRDEMVEKKGDVSAGDVALIEAESSVLIADAAKNLNEVAEKIGIVVDGYQHQGRQGI